LLPIDIGWPSLNSNISERKTNILSISFIERFPRPSYSNFLPQTNVDVKFGSLNGLFVFVYFTSSERELSSFNLRFSSSDNIPPLEFFPRLDYFQRSGVINNTDIYENFYVSNYYHSGKSS
uniref:CUB domain-containing protein n=1 Tax=Ascaris lumbricoides TaxID=6252 RepID=A0A0M3ILM9_ASCLU